MIPEDAELLARVRERDAEAFETLLSRHREPLRRRLASMIRDASAVEDLLQEVFLRVWTHADDWDGRGPFKAWLFRIATNLALNHLRSVRRRREQPLELPPDWSDDEEESSTPSWLIDPSLGPEKLLDLADRRERLLRLVEGLPEEKREVFRLVHEEEMAMGEVAGRLGIPEGTVKSRLYHARQWLAREWREREETE